MSRPPASSSSSGKRPSDSTSKPEPLNLTIGCEFEFLLAHYCGDKKPTSWDRDAPAKKVVREALRGPLLVICDVCGKSHESQLRLSDEEYDDYERWQVAHDGTATPIIGQTELLGEYQDQYEFFSIELKSRILNCESKEKKAECGHSFKFAEEIRALLTKLNDRFGTFSSEDGWTEYFAFVNPKCAFHVHVGNGKNSFPLPTVQKIMSLFLACERQIDGLHARNRIMAFDIDPPFNLPERPLETANFIELDEFVYTLPLSMFFMIEANIRRRKDEEARKGALRDRKTQKEPRSKKYPETQPDDSTTWSVRCRNDIDAWVTLVSNAPDLKSLGDLHHNLEKRCNINICNLPYGPKDPQRNDKSCTIEFKQHAGTLEPIAALSFIDFAVSLVRYCHEANDDEFYQLIGFGGDFRGPSFTTSALCREIGCRKETQTYYENRLDTKSKLVSPWLDNQQNAAEHAVENHDPLGSLILKNIDLERENNKPSNVTERISHKFTKGGYGQFTEDILHSLLSRDVDPKRRMRLCLGQWDPVQYPKETPKDPHPNRRRFDGYASDPEPASSSESDPPDNYSLHSTQELEPVEFFEDST